MPRKYEIHGNVGGDQELSPREKNHLGGFGGGEIEGWGLPSFIKTGWRGMTKGFKKAIAPALMTPGAALVDTLSLATKRGRQRPYSFVKSVWR